MKLVSYMYEGETAVGIIGRDPDKLVSVQSLCYQSATMPEFIRELGGVIPEGLLDFVDRAGGVALSDCRLLAPIKHPEQDVVCLGCNYMEHRREVDDKLQVNVDMQQMDTIYFSKRVNEAVDPGGIIDGHFDLVDSLDYEVELAAVIGKDAYKVSRGEVQDYVLGYTILNDVSARNLQSKHQQWYFGKSLDGFTPMGPWIVTADELGWKPELEIRSYLNGALRQSANTNMMMKQVDDVVAELSQGMTLRAGTMIALGTPSGVGAAMEPKAFMKSGDVIRCEIEGIGVLENTIG